MGYASTRGADLKRAEKQHILRQHNIHLWWIGTVCLRAAGATPAHLHLRHSRFTQIPELPTACCQVDDWHEAWKYEGASKAIDILIYIWEPRYCFCSIIINLLGDEPWLSLTFISRLMRFWFHLLKGAFGMRARGTGCVYRAHTGVCCLRRRRTGSTVRLTGSVSLRLHIWLLTVSLCNAASGTEQRTSQMNPKRRRIEPVIVQDFNVFSSWTKAEKLSTLVLFFSLSAGSVNRRDRVHSTWLLRLNSSPHSECGGLNLHQSMRHYAREAAVLHYASCLFIHPSHFFPPACRAADV